MPERREGFRKRRAESLRSTASSRGSSLIRSKSVHDKDSGSLSNEFKRGLRRNVPIAARRMGTVPAMKAGCILLDTSWRRARTLPQLTEEDLKEPVPAVSIALYTSGSLTS